MANFTRTYKSNVDCIKGAIVLHYNGEYYENESLNIRITRLAWNDWIVSKKPGKWITNVKYFDRFRDCIDYLIIFQPELSEHIREAFLPDCDYIAPDWYIKGGV